MKSRIANGALAPEGERSYRWAFQHMPTLGKAIQIHSRKNPLDGHRLGVCLHVTKETAVLVMGLKQLGAEVFLAGANPLSTQDDIAAFLASEGITVFAWRDESPEEYRDCIGSVLSGQPQIIMDDGADAHSLLHDSAKFAGQRPLGGTEETTTGVIRLKALEREGKLRYPIIAVNNAKTKFLFDNRYGTGQSTFDGILRATSLLIAGKKVVVAGYGWVGKGIAARAKGLGALVIVTETDPLKALEARMDGFEVMPMAEAARLGDLFITATGQLNVIRREHIAEMRDGAILANAGHFDVEVDVKGLQEESTSRKVVRPNVEEFTLRRGKKIYLIGRGRIANLVAAEGHPPEVMSMSFANQLLSVLYISRHSESLSKAVLDVPHEIDTQVASLTLDALEIRIDKLTKEQLEYATSWRV